jgi:predicted AAA+ superfamily ATPase
MTDSDLAPLLTRIAEALERLAPAAPPPWDFTLARLFRCEPGSLTLTPAPDYPLSVDLLLGVDRQKRLFTSNLERFAQGLPANPALLWGVRGGGKSSMAKAAFMDVASRHPDLRLVEIEADHVSALPRLFERLRHVSERVVVFCDDLSFEEGAGEAKALKSALEGGVAGPPANVLFVATSNRRHLMPREHVSDDRMAAAEDAEETVSVSDRFGLWISFPPMDQPTYLAAINTYAQRFGLSDPQLERRALQWSVQRGSRSGRVAMQFIRDLAGEQGKRLPV